MTRVALPRTAPLPPGAGSVARIAIVEGEGIGPHVIAGCLTVLEAAMIRHGHDVDVTLVNRGTRDFYQSCFSSGMPVLHGPVGGRFVYDLRRDFDLFGKITPVETWPELADASLLRPDRISGVDVVIVRDNAAGLYQGAFGIRDSDGAAFQTAEYGRAQVEQIMRLACDVASQRSGRLAVTLKAGGVPTISRLWQEVAEATRDEVELEFIDIDNACFQLVANPGRFDVLVAPNMFGDVLGDTSTLLLGSRGLSYSVNLNDQGNAVYQTAHGAAYDLAGKDLANPLGQLISLAWLVRDSLGLPEVAETMMMAARAVVNDGFRTFDIAGPTSTNVGTEQMCSLIATYISREKS